MATLFEPAQSANATKASGPGPEIRNGLPRAVDIIGSLVGLVLFMPLLLFSALTVALSSPGGIFFKQQRVGRSGQLFTLYKLRTMKPSNSGPQVTSRADGRITPVGKFLRQTKIDELPTLWNVLCGDMSLVGPRPEVPRYVDLENVQWQRVLKTRPGITDPVTLQLRNEEELLAQAGGDTERFYLDELQPLKLKGYVAYLEVRTWRSDLRALWQTSAAVIIPRDFRPPTGKIRHGDPELHSLLHASTKKEPRK